MKPRVASCRFLLSAALAACVLLPFALNAAQVSQAAGERPMASNDYANTRYSDLAQITPNNAKNLQLAFTFSTGVVRGHEAAPVVVGGTMYMVTPYPDVVYVGVRDGRPVDHAVLYSACVR
jgi:lanthanide-dependent methanol dehydrogenase